MTKFLFTKGHIVSEETRKKISETHKRIGSGRGNKIWLGRRHSEESKEKLRQARLGKIASEETKKKLSIAHKGRISWNKGKTTPDAVRQKISASTKGKPKSSETRARMSAGCMGRPILKEARIKIGLANKGEKSALWKGGITPINAAIRASKEYKEWRKCVFTRDDFTCQACGQYGGQLQVDHELPFALYPDLRFEVLNGRVLCKGCHLKTATFGGRVLQHNF